MRWWLLWIAVQPVRATVRHWWLIAFVLVVWAAYVVTVHGQGKGYNLASGRLDAENGGIECYFGIAAGEDAFGLAPHPNGIACVRLKEFAGKTGTLFWIPD